MPSYFLNLFGGKPAKLDDAKTATETFIDVILQLLVSIFGIKASCSIGIEIGERFAGLLERQSSFRRVSVAAHRRAATPPGPST